MATEFTVSLAAVQQRAITTIDVALATYNPTPWLYELLPGVTRDVAHLTFGVGIIESKPVDNSGKQRAGTNLNAVATVGIRLLFTSVAEDMQDSYTSALLAGDLVIVAMIDAADSDGANAKQKWRWNSSRTSVAADGTHIMIEQRYTCWFHVFDVL